jgi:predicted esterase YcpF (UPF0227 family)
MMFRSTGPRHFPIRMATQRIHVDGQSLIIEVADPQGKFQAVLSEFNSILSFALPLVLIIAALGGYWLSGRALAPVDQIRSSMRPGQSTPSTLGRDSPCPPPATSSNGSQKR